MNYKNNIAKYALCILTAGALLTACQKMDRPPLGDYPKMPTLPVGRLNSIQPLTVRAPTL